MKNTGNIYTINNFQTIFFLLVLFQSVHSFLYIDLCKVRPCSY